ncbi:hypothetical protein BGW36DRAFT_359228 [Talaromyces proteolyticus]|uniref:FAD/NAD(P)-binding domain-containing protein n=1 Tax=Talaromyces proteolyticus TaxID=1131652 RepID=A0AAD4KSL4_9EURO|nr:uncharacterized protein BGW36DRAFT_359228 [Talaromyces proteolyticus]KAH8697437.1 hypothetical protein BGW36DRAFT_359228 [Talaromyces proteolyticus]
MNPANETMTPKKVAIIGAGPSGLVTAKALLHHSPGRYEPTIFESKPVIGGLWATNRLSRQQGFIPASMRTNLSRFTVSFSDLSWEEPNTYNGNGSGMFPRAAQVNDYLQRYCEKFIPDEVLKLCCRVVRTMRNEDSQIDKSQNEEERRRWTVEWVDESKPERSIYPKKKKKRIYHANIYSSTVSSSFDYLVVASGFFGTPHIPSIPGLHNFPSTRAIHSSSLHSPSDFLAQLTTNHADPTGTILVVGGSMSGAEAASALALSLSSLPSHNLTIKHISSRPFWPVPTYLPDQSGGFIPLDLALYDLSRRPPGDVQYTLGPVPAARARAVHDYFSSLLSSSQPNLLEPSSSDRDHPPWVAVTDHYNEFVRSGTIHPLLGRLESLTTSTNTAILRHPTGTTEPIPSILAIVFATGFTPFPSLSPLLPNPVLSALNYSPTHPLFPLLLDAKATLNPLVPDLGFVGMYRGPYWGVMEMQARSLAVRWGDSTCTPGTSHDLSACDSIRSLREQNSSIAQFPMGDYVGLMETYARELGIARADIQNENGNDDDERVGPVVPARYATPKTPDSAATLAALRALMAPASAGRRDALCHAVFRALHGKWRVSSTADGKREVELCPRVCVSGPSEGDVEYEYCDSEVEGTCVFRLVDKRIHILTTSDGSTVVRRIEFVGMSTEGEEGGVYRHVARGVVDGDEGDVVEYVFRLKGVHVVSWEERGRVYTRPTHHH